MRGPEPGARGAVLGQRAVGSRWMLTSLALLDALKFLLNLPCGCRKTPSSPLSLPSPSHVFGTLIQVSEPYDRVSRSATRSGGLIADMIVTSAGLTPDRRMGEISGASVHVRMSSSSRFIVSLPGGWNSGSHPICQRVQKRRSPEWNNGCGEPWQGTNELHLSFFQSPR